MTRLTPDEIGQDEFDRCWRDKAWFRSIPSAAKGHASARGNLCIANIVSATSPDTCGAPRLDRDFFRFEQDAVMFARMAHKGWRAYRVMVGE